MVRYSCPAKSCNFDIFRLLHPEHGQSFANINCKHLNQVRMNSIHVQKCSAYEDVANIPSSFHEVIIYKTSGTTKEVPMCPLCAARGYTWAGLSRLLAHLEGLLTSLLTQSDTYFANWVHWSHRHSQSESRPLVSYFDDHWYIWTVASGCETAGWKVNTCVTKRGENMCFERQICIKIVQPKS